MSGGHGIGLGKKGGMTPSQIARLEYLENNEYEVTYFEEFNATTGTVTVPTGGTILLNQFAGGVDAYVSTVSSSQPTGILPRTAGGVAVDVSSFDSSGNFTLSGTPSAYPIAIIYVFKIPADQWQNVNLDRTVDYKQTGFQPLDTELTALAALTSAADEFPYFTGSGTASLLTIVSAIRTLLSSADVATFRTNAGLAIGTDVQAYSSTLSNISKGTYTPTLTNGANAAASTAYTTYYTRIGNEVIVSGKIDIDPTSSGTITVVRMSLPIASNFGNSEEAGGTAVCPTIAQSMSINASVANDELVYQGVPSSNANATYFFFVKYTIL